jgi:hypothetical protein
MPFAIYGIFLIEKIIRKLHDSYPNEWEKAGRPSGIFRNPPSINNIESAFSMLKNITVWLFSTPAWIKDEAAVSSNLMQLRICALVWNVGIMALMVFIFISLQENLFQVL